MKQKRLHKTFFPPLPFHIEQTAASLYFPHIMEQPVKAMRIVEHFYLKLFRGGKFL